MNFCIVGAGAWGTAVAQYLANLGHVVTLLPRRMEHALTLSSLRVNEDYLPGLRFHEDMQIGHSIRPSVLECDYLFLACPSHALRASCRSIIPFRDEAKELKGGIALCKGLEPSTNKFPHEIIQEELGPDFSCGYLTGPSHAHDVAVGKPAAMVLASNGGEERLLSLQNEIHSKSLRIYRSNDLMGVALGSCLKNVYAIAAGLSDGLGLGDNARAALLTRSMSEMMALGQACGGRCETFMGLSGFGDLIGTCMGDWSRNRNFGLDLANGRKAREIIASQKTVVEGFGATSCFFEKSRKLSIEMPILQEVYAILHEDKDPGSAILDLMSRDVRAEDDITSELPSN